MSAMFWKQSMQNMRLQWSAARRFSSVSAPINVGIIGAGRIGLVHAETLAFRTPNARPVIIADASEASAAKAAAAFNIPQWSSDYRSVLTNPAVQAVWICSPVGTHAAFIEEAAAHGKHVFCEKPMGRNIPEIEAAVAAVKAAGTKLMVGFNRRFDSNYRRVRTAIETGEIGDAHVFHITSRDPSPPPIEYVKSSGGIFIDMAIHDFDMARFLMGCECESIYAQGACRVDPRIAAAGDIDTAVLSLKFKNGAIGSIDLSRKAVYGYDQRVEVFGSKGAVATGNEHPNQAWISTESSIRRDLPLNFFMDRYIEAYRRETIEFVNAIQTGGVPSTSGMDSRQALVMALTAKESLRRGQPVTIAEMEEIIAEEKKAAKRAVTAAAAAAVNA